jgi:hypothetical protein
MTTLSDLKKRLAKLELTKGQTLVTFKMRDGTTRTILNSRLLQVFTEALPDDGIRGKDFNTVVTSVSNNADHKLVQLFRMCVD